MANGPAVDISIKKKQFSPAGKTLFSDFSLTVSSGEVVALIGPSGVGKTTLLRMIGGVDTDFAGNILIQNVAANEAPPPGFVFQDARLLPWLTSIENIKAVHDKIEVGVVKTLISRVGLTGYLHAYPHQLSGGMQRRLGLARALSVNPQLLLLDEPFVSLDSIIVDDLQALFQSIFTADKPTVIIVSHNPEDAARLADRAVILKGRPAHIVADFNFNVPRHDRGPIEIATLVRQIQTAGMDTAC